MKKIKEYLKKNWFMSLLVLLLGVACVMLYVSYEHEKKIRRSLEQIDTIDTLNNVFNRKYYEEEISSLKKKNKSLYDSIYAYKDKVSYLLQFKYEKEYDSGKVETGKKDSTTVINDTIQEYHYANELNDTMNYNLTVASVAEPDWYRLRVKISDKFTIINRTEENGQNIISIGGEGHGTISDVTTFKRKEKRTFLDRIAVGPGVTVGYDPFNKKMTTSIGVNATFDLLHK